MLVYHPSLDPSHGMFRMLTLVDASPDKMLHFDTFRILDFYYLFPHLLVPVRLPPKLLARKRKLASYASRYSRVPAPKIFVQQLRPLQELVARSLAAKGLLDPAELESGKLSRTEVAVPGQIVELLQARTASEKELVELLASEVSQVPLLGSDGLKARTGLLEYRYDPS